MLLEVKLILDEKDVYKLVLRTVTQNELELIHTEVLDLKTDSNAIRDRLLMGTVINFAGVNAIATDEAVAECKANDAAVEKKEQAAAEIFEGEVVA